MGSLISKIADEIKLHGSYKAYCEFTAAQSRAYDQEKERAAEPLPRTPPHEMSQEGPLRIHELKTWPGFFQEAKAGNKNFELRFDDREYQLGDVLKLREWDPERQEYSGEIIHRQISYILRGGEPSYFGIKEGWVCIAMKRPPFIDTLKDL